MINTSHLRYSVISSYIGNSTFVIHVDTDIINPQGKMQVIKYITGSGSSAAPTDSVSTSVNDNRHHSHRGSTQHNQCRAAHSQGGSAVTSAGLSATLAGPALLHQQGSIYISRVLNYISRALHLINRALRVHPQDSQPHPQGY